MEICVFYFVITFEIVFATYNASNHSNDFQMTITPGHRINVTEGQHLQVTCSISYPIGHGAALYWQAQGKGSGLITQKRVNDSTVMLVVTYAVRSDAGFYKCIYNNSRDPIMWKGLFISVLSKSKDGAKCPHTQFLCETDKHCIFLRYRCNGQQDCKDGSDEKKCDECVGKFRCHSGKCINSSLVCDENHNNDCGDWSDEYCLMANQYRTEKTTTFNITAKDKDKDHMTWLKTTVYVVIGCTVSVVLFISIIVIAVFRIRMKRDAFRHTERALERGRNRPASGARQNDGNNSRGLESDPFISSATYGNIIVNVNNGVQYVPGIDFTPITCPPSYSDVERETHARQGSPPPDYSTVDRNPLRPSLLLVDGSNSIRTGTDHSPTTFAANLSNHCVNNESFSDVELNPTVSSVGTQTPPATAQTSGRNQANAGNTILPNTNLVLVQSATVVQPRQPNLDIQGGEIVIAGAHTSVLSEYEEQSPRRRSGLLQVHDGNLSLTSESINGTSRHSQEPDRNLILDNENLTCDESTALLTSDNAIGVGSQNLNQRNKNAAQLQVHDGQIVLSNQTLPALMPVRQPLNDSENETIQREIGVQEGQIIFK